MQNLINGIQHEADAEKERILKEAEAQCRQKKETAELQCRRIIEAAGIKAREREEEITRITELGLQREQKHAVLAKQEKIIGMVLENLRQAFGRLKDDPAYPEILQSWILEAACGLASEEVVLSAGIEEQPLVTGNMLRRVEEEYTKITGGQTRIQMAEQPLRQGRGIILKDRSGRLAYDNRVEQRIRRGMRVIRKVIHAGFFADENKE